MTILIYLKNKSALPALCLAVLFMVSAVPVRAQNNYKSPVNALQGRPLRTNYRLLEASPIYSTPLLKGLRFDPANPLKLEFIIDTADQKKVDKEEAAKLVKYFLAGLTLPEDDLWVNLSPYEKDRVAPDLLADTDLGKTMLEQDYLLKQLAASLTYPETPQGKAYWGAMNGVGANLCVRPNDSGQTHRSAPTDTFNKVWITPNVADIYENNNTGFITNATMKVMMEQDYLAMNKNNVGAQRAVPENKGTARRAPTDPFKQNILPLIEKEVNSGKHFASLRQIYSSLILAVWFKQKFQDSLYKNYIDQRKIQGIDLNDPGLKDKIWNQYVTAFKTGAYDYVKCEYVGVGSKPTRDKGQGTNLPLRSGKITKRRYFSGGVAFNTLKPKVETAPLPASRHKFWRNVLGGVLIATIAVGVVAISKSTVAQGNEMVSVQERRVGSPINRAVKEVRFNPNEEKLFRTIIMPQMVPLSPDKQRYVFDKIPLIWWVRSDEIAIIANEIIPSLNFLEFSSGHIKTIPGGITFWQERLGKQINEDNFFDELVKHSKKYARLFHALAMLSPGQQNRLLSIVPPAALEDGILLERLSGVISDWPNDSKSLDTLLLFAIKHPEIIRYQTMFSIFSFIPTQDTNVLEQYLLQMERIGKIEDKALQQKHIRCFQGAVYLIRTLRQNNLISSSTAVGSILEISRAQTIADYDSFLQKHLVPQLRIELKAKMGLAQAGKKALSWQDLLIFAAVASENNRGFTGKMVQRVQGILVQQGINRSDTGDFLVGLAYAVVLRFYDDPILAKVPPSLAHEHRFHAYLQEPWSGGQFADGSNKDNFAPMRVNGPTVEGCLLAVPSELGHLYEQLTLQRIGFSVKAIKSSEFPDRFLMSAAERFQNVRFSASAMAYVSGRIALAREALARNNDMQLLWPQLERVVGYYRLQRLAEESRNGQGALAKVLSTSELYFLGALIEEMVPVGTYVHQGRLAAIRAQINNTDWHIAINHTVAMPTQFTPVTGVLRDVVALPYEVLAVLGDHDIANRMASDMNIRLLVLMNQGNISYDAFSFLVGKASRAVLEKAAGSTHWQAYSGAIEKISFNDVTAWLKELRAQGIFDISNGAMGTRLIGHQAYTLNKLKHMNKIFDLLRGTSNKSDDEIVLNLIESLKKAGLASESADTQDENIYLVTIDDVKAQAIIDSVTAEKNLKRTARIIRDLVTGSAKRGVKAINLKNKDGSYTVVGLASGLVPDGITLKHERREIYYLRKGWGPIAAHNQAAAETEGAQLDKTTGVDHINGGVTMRAKDFKIKTQVDGRGRGLIHQTQDQGVMNHAPTENNFDYLTFTITDLKDISVNEAREFIVAK